MELISCNASLNGAVRIPASKSHTIRALLIATLADGESILLDPLSSGDTESCLRACEQLGARITREPGKWIVRGTGLQFAAPVEMIDVGNSGTTLYLALSVAALGNEPVTFTGDYQIQRRSAQSLLDSLTDLGASATSEKRNGCAPITVCGPLKGGATAIECPTSQYLSSLLLSCPLALGDTDISIPLLNEQPYVEMTLDWITRHGVTIEYENFSRFHVKGGQQYFPVNQAIPSDFSSATFFLVAAAITGADVVLHGLDMSDSQGDKAVVHMLEAMGIKTDTGTDYVRVCGGELTGTELDLNATPDALPALAVAGCFAKGETWLVNVPQARQKETDRIMVMCSELKKLGADIEELPDGLIIRESALTGGNVKGYDDHRVVMAMGVAGLCASGTVRVDTAEAMAITFPTFVELMNTLGAQMEIQ
jgi:3-phosphoshikimate 1-carboxyvinyltransferase